MPSSVAIFTTSIMPKLVMFHSPLFPVQSRRLVFFSDWFVGVLSLKIALRHAVSCPSHVIPVQTASVQTASKLHPTSKPRLTVKLCIIIVACRNAAYTCSWNCYCVLLLIALF